MARMSFATAILMVLALESAWAVRLGKDFPRPLSPTCLVQTGPVFKDCSVVVPPKATTCTVVFGQQVPSVLCQFPAAGLFFGSPFTVQIPDIPGVPSCDILPGSAGQAPTINCGSGLPVVPPTTPQGPRSPLPGDGPSEPIVLGRTLIPPPGAGSCTATNLQEGQTPSVECSPATDGQTPFPRGTLLELPTGEFGSCQFSADENGETQIGCVGIPLLAIPEPLVNGNVITPPPGSKSCTISRSERGATPTATCEPAGPGEVSFQDGVTLEIPEGASSCTSEADPIGQALTGCAAFPPEPLTVNVGGIPVPQGSPLFKKDLEKLG